MIKFGKYQLNLIDSSAIIPVDFDRLDIKEADGYLLFDHRGVDDFEQKGVKFLSKDELYAKKEEEIRVIDDARFTSSSTVVPLLIDRTFFTTVFNVIPYIYKLHEADPSLCFVINETEIANLPEVRSSLAAMFSYMRMFFDSQNIEYIYISPEDPLTAVKVSRYVDFSKQSEEQDLSLQDVLVSVKKIQEHLNVDTSLEPFRRVYLSRVHLAKEKSETYPIFQGGENRFNSDIRMENEDVLVDYFKSKGYEVIVPEQDFKTFEDQVRYFNEVKVLVSVSGSGLANQIFMQEGTYVIDLGAELVFPSNSVGSFQILDNAHWLSNSYINHQIFISVPTRRDPHKAIERLNKLFESLNV